MYTSKGHKINQMIYPMSFFEIPKHSKLTYQKRNAKQHQIRQISRLHIGNYFTFCHFFNSKIHFYSGKCLLLSSTGCLAFDLHI